jgi:pimeloyl-ACP methyl ester carboxylesterase
MAGRPTAPTIIHLHGYAAAADQWRPLMDRLAGDYRLLAPDLLGFGEAPTPPPPYTIARWLAQLGPLLGLAGERPVVLVGHSLGGLIAVEAARRWPARLAALALIDPLGIPPPLFAVAAQGPARRAVAYFHHSGASDRLFAWVRRQQRLLAGPLALSAFHDPGRAPATAIAEWRRLISRPGAEHAFLDVVRRVDTLTTALQPGEVTHPALIIWGRQDRLLPVRLAAAWQARLPQAELVVLDRCGHVPHIEQVAAVEQALRRLLARAGLGRPASAVGPAEAST